MTKSFTLLKRHRREVPTVFASGSSRPSEAMVPLPLSVSPVARSLLPAVKIKPVPLPLRQSDRRLFNPQPAFSTPAKRLTGKQARVVPAPLAKRATARSKALPGYSQARLLFSAPANVQICVQRGVRKEVMHAKKLAGKTGFRKPKYNHYSKVRC